MTKIRELLQVSEEEIFKVRSFYGKTENSIEEDLLIIKEWMKKQPHLPSMLDDGRLEKFFLRNKFRMERTKLKIDKYFSLRGIYREFFKTYDVESEALRNTILSQVYVPMPKLTEKQERIMVYKVINPDPELFNCCDLSSFLLIMEDICSSHDYAVGERIIKDWSNFSMSHFKKMEPTTLVKLMKLHQEAFSCRIISMEYINSPPFMDLLLQLLKPVFKEKIFGRIKIHKDLESLHQTISKEYLPKELGGTQESIFELHKSWLEELKIQKKFLEENAKFVSNENLRIGTLYENELFGFDGTFKKLNLD